MLVPCGTCWSWSCLKKSQGNASKMICLCLQVNEGDSEDTDLQIFCVSCSHPVNPKVALRHMERCYAKVIYFFYLFIFLRFLTFASHIDKYKIVWTIYLFIYFPFILIVWESDLLWFHVPYQNRRVRRKISVNSFNSFFLMFSCFNLQSKIKLVFFPTEQPGSSVMCTTPKAKHIVRGFKFCVQNIPEILRSVGTTQPCRKSTVYTWPNKSNCSKTTILIILYCSLKESNSCLVWCGV